MAHTRRARQSGGAERWSAAFARPLRRTARDPASASRTMASPRLVAASAWIDRQQPVHNAATVETGDCANHGLAARTELRPRGLWKRDVKALLMAREELER